MGREGASPDLVGGSRLFALNLMGTNCSSESMVADPVAGHHVRRVAALVRGVPLMSGRYVSPSK